MSAHFHELEDGQGDLVELVTFCGDWCHRSWCVDHDAIYGGWNGCHEIEYQEPCAQCGVVIPGVELDVDQEQHVRCDRCGIGVDAVDGWTNDILVFCGGLYGNGCDAVYLASEDAVVNGDAVGGGVVTKRVYQTGPRFGQQMADRKKREREAVAS